MSANRIGETLTWLGGGEWRDLGERHEPCTHVIAGVVILLAAALAWLVSTFAITEATCAPMAVIVPPIIASAIDTTTKPLRSARQVFEETEEIHFSLRRTHKVSVQSEEHGSVVTEPVEPQTAPASVVRSVERQQMMTGREGHPELRGADGPRQLPPAD